MTGDAERSEDELTAHVNDAQRCMFGIGMAGTAVAYTTVRGLIAGIQRLTAERDAALRDLAELRDKIAAVRDTMQREHDLGRIVLVGYLRLLNAALAASGSVTAGEQT